MKLARPDIRHPRIVLAGSQSGDDAGLVAALRNRGLHARWLSWDDPDTLDADLVILRAGTDYADRRDEFLAWTRRVPNLLNAPDVVAWNTGRHYLRDLRDAGVPTRSGARPPRPPNGVGVSRRRPVPRIHGVGSRRSRPTSNCGTSGRPRLQAAADHLGIGVEELLYARADVVGEPGDAEAGGAESGCAVVGLAAARRRRSRRSGSVSSRCASSQPWTGWGWVRSRIEAHNAAVAAVHIAAPATWTATSAAGTPVKNCTVPTAA